jgi:hypothetical protein
MSSEDEIDVEIVVEVGRTRDGLTVTWAFVWSSRPSTAESKHHLVHLGPQPQPDDPIPLGPITTCIHPSR